MAIADDELLALLPKVPIFGGLEGEPLRRVIGLLGEVSYEANATVFQQGERGRSMYIVRTGEVVICRDRQGRRTKMIRLGPGEAFGEMCLVEIQPRSATVVTGGPTRLLALTQKDLASLYAKDLHTYVLILGNIARELSRRLRRADERLVELAEKSDDAETTQIRPAAKRRT